MVRVHRVLPVLAVVSTLALAGCGSAGDSDTSTAAPPTASSAATSPPSSPATAVVPERLAFTGKTVDGKNFDAATVAGKPVVLWFWAPWCVKCRTAAPDVAKTAARYDGKVTVVGVAGLANDTGSMRDFVAGTSTGDLTHLADTRGTLWKRFGVTSQHTFVLLRADGSVVHTGPLSSDQLADRVAALAG